MAESSRQMLRDEGRRRRRAVAGDARVTAESRIAGHLASVDLPVHAVVGVTVADDGEPDLSTAVAAMRSAGRAVALPVLRADDTSMRFRRWLDGDALVEGRFGIPCPPPGDDRDVVPALTLVPLVRFDSAGNRLGRGAGFYDRWLAAHDTRVVGVAFEVQRAEALEPQPHDVPLDAVVTELGVRWFT